MDRLPAGSWPSPLSAESLVSGAVSITDVVPDGSNLFGVTDLVALLTDDHKFESQYTFGLVGPWPDAADDYAARSPINHVAELSSPMIVLQGADDTVVPQSHSDLVVDALRQRGRPVAYLVFEGEGHGFRGRDALVRWFEGALSFHGQVLGFTPADDVEPIAIDNL
jgi:dipeptidyl aminopeptidase/acylaminoacyl peptidase